jgi:hypothetical protein
MSLNDVVGERRHLTKYHVARLMTTAAPAIPLTTPPAVAPTFEFFELVDDVVEDLVVAPPKNWSEKQTWCSNK